MPPVSVSSSVRVAVAVFVAVTFTVAVFVMVTVTAAAAAAFGRFLVLIVGGGHAQFAEEVVEIDMEIPGALFQRVVLGDDAADVLDAEAFEHFGGGGTLFDDFADGHFFCDHHFSPAAAKALFPRRPLSDRAVFLNIIIISDLR